MPQLVPLESLGHAHKPLSQGFELALPNLIMGKTLFLLLPAAADWTYEIRELRANRNLVLRDQMWVTRGEARLVAVPSKGASGARIAVSVKIRPWRPKIRPEVAGPRIAAATTPASKPPDERTPTRSGLGWLRLVLRAGSEEGLRIRCHHTQRQIEIRWRTGGADVRAQHAAPLPSYDFQRLLAACQCH